MFPVADVSRAQLVIRLPVNPGRRNLLPWGVSLELPALGFSAKDAGPARRRGRAPRRFRVQGAAPVGRGVDWVRPELGPDMESRESYLRASLWLLGATLVATVFFAAVPGLDLWVAARFWEADTGTWHGDRAGYVLLRDLARVATYAALIAALVMMLVALLLRGASASGWRVWAYMVATIAVGPGLIVNAILKAQFGRARPDDVGEFGGSAAFTPAWQISDECLRNCSFVSGEAAMMAAVVIPPLVLMWPRLSRAGRWIAGASGVVLMAGTGMLRVIMGRHFLSDVILAALFSALVALVLYRLLGIASAREGFGMAAIRRDLRLVAARLHAPLRNLVGSGRAGVRDGDKGASGRGERDGRG